MRAKKNEADLRFSDYVHDASAWVDTLKKMPVSLVSVSLDIAKDL